MNLKLVIFDDSDNRYLAPFSSSRSVSSLRRGCFTQGQRICKYFEEFAEFENTQNLNDLELLAGEYLLVNSSVKLNSDLVVKIKDLKVDCLLLEKQKERIVAIKTKVSSKFTYKNLEKCSNVEYCEDALCEHWWDLVADNGQQINDDFKLFFDGADSFSIPGHFVTMLNPYSVWLGKDVEIDPGAVIDARNGAIIIDDGAKIGSQAVVQGPCYIGENSVINPFAHLKNGATIGNYCKIGGEVDGAIIDDFSNKQHYGFIGESYIGSWVNLGAGTTCSDLKNNYSQVKSYSYGEEKINTERQFLGCVVGDYTKLGIGSMINTGAYIGTACCIFGTELIQGKIGNFRFGTADSVSLYEFEKFLETLKIVKGRRGEKIASLEKKRLEKIYKKELKFYGC